MCYMSFGSMYLGRLILIWGKEMENSIEGQRRKRQARDGK